MGYFRRFLVCVFFFLYLYGIGLGGQQGILLESTSNDIKINLGIRAGVAVGVTGRVFLQQIIGSENVRIYVAKFVVISADLDTADAQILQRTESVKQGYFVEFDKPLAPKPTQSPSMPESPAARPVPQPERPRKSLDDVEKDFRSYVEQAEFYFNRGDYPRSFDYYSRAQQEKPQDTAIIERLTKLQRIIRGDIAVVEDMRIEPLRFKPFEQNTSIHFTLSVSSGASLLIRNASGYDSIYKSDVANVRQGSFAWDGFQGNGKIVPNGVYEYTIQAAKSGGSESSRTKRVDIRVHSPFGAELLPAYELKIKKASLNSTGGGILWGAILGAVMGVEEGQTRGGNMLMGVFLLGGIGLVVDLVDMMGVGPHNEAERKKAREIEEHNSRVKNTLTIEQREIR